MHRARNGQGPRLSFLITAQHTPSEIDQCVVALGQACRSRTPPMQEDKTIDQHLAFKQEPFGMYPLRVAGLPFRTVKDAATRVLEICPKYLRQRTASPVPSYARLAASLFCRMMIPPPCTEKYPFSIGAMTRISFSGSS